jgi:outer membrane protein TolC
MQRKTYLAVFALALAGVSLSGCARPGERPVMRAIKALEDSLYAKPPEVRADDVPPNASLDEWLLHAERQNPGLKAAFHYWQAAAEKIPQVRALPDPRLSYAYFVRNVETRVGPQEHGFAISQTFPWFGKLARRGDAAVESARVAERRYEALRLRLFYAVSREYAEHYYLARAVEITDENLELLQHWEEVARAKFRAGTGTHAEVVQAQVEIGVLTDRVRTLSDQRSAVLAELNALLSRRADAPVVAPDSLADESIETTDAELLDLLREASPELQALQFEVERKRHELALAGKDYFPNFTLGVGYTVTGDAINPEMEDSGKDPLTALLSINVPIWRGKYAAGTREAEARLQAARLEHEDRTFKLDARVKRVAFELRDAGRKVTLYRDTLIPKGEQSLQATSTAFEAGRLEFLNVIDAQRVLLEFQLAYEHALSDQLSSLGRLEMLVGQQLPHIAGTRR